MANHSLCILSIQLAVFVAPAAGQSLLAFLPLYLVVLVDESFLVALVYIARTSFWTLQLLLVLLEGRGGAGAVVRGALSSLGLAVPAVLPDLHHDLGCLPVVPYVDRLYFVPFLRSHLDLVLRRCLDHDLTRPHLGQGGERRVSSVRVPFGRGLLLLFVLLLVLLEGLLAPVVRSTVAAVVRLVVRHLVALHQLRGGLRRRQVPSIVGLRSSGCLYLAGRGLPWATGSRTPLLLLLVARRRLQYRRRLHRRLRPLLALLLSLQCVFLREQLRLGLSLLLGPLPLPLLLPLLI